MTTMACTTKPSEPIAIVGSSCRFAGHVNSPSKLWDVLCNAPDLSREVPPDRFNAKGFYHKDAEYHGTTNSIKAYWLEQSPHLFDAAFFNITPKEAEAMDPQQRLLLEVVFEAMESAGFPLARYSGKEVGVFSGCMTQDYETLSARDELATSQYFPTGNSRAIMSNRISYYFNFQGPSMTIDTACSSSLVALHQAMLSLRTGECVMACVTGANLMLTPEQFIVESTLHMLSPSGKCHMWDTSADGYARGEGFATVLLKPLSRAIADGDRIEAVIREVGINADGKTNGITMPNPAAQASLIRKTYQRAGLDPTNPSDRCQYFEAHGTGTTAGDPREAAAIHEAFFAGSGSSRDDDTEKKILVGSVKTVIGHTEAAAGLAGVLKTVWSMKHGLIPPNLHFQALSPSVKPYYTHLQIPTTIVPWPDPPPGQPRRASVNSFGFGGANAHAIIESYTPQIRGATSSVIGCSETCESEIDAPAAALARLHSSPHPEKDASPFSLPIVISAASLKSLRDVVQSYRTYLAQNKVNIHELSWHQYVRRTGLLYQVSFSAASTSGALEALDSLLLLNESTIPAAHATRPRITKSPLRILGIFTGQGAQWPTMSMSLFRQNGVYRDTIRKLDAVLKACPHPCPWTLEEQIMAGKDVARTREAAVSQPLCTALQIALVDFMRSIGIGFHTVIGHSSGEIAAAYAAGRLSAEDAIVVSYYRGMVAHLACGSDGQKGGMLAVGMSESEAVSFCSGSMFDGHIRIAASNSPTSVTLSGDLDAIHLAHKELSEKKKFSRVLQVDTAYHSRHMAKPVVNYIKAMREYGVSPVQEGNGATWISSVEHRPRTGAQDLDCQYWADNMVHQVQFRDAVEYALSQPGDEFDCAIEIGPHPALKGPVTQTAKALGRDILYSCPMNRTKNGGLAVAEFIGFIWSNFGSLKVDLRSFIEQSPMPNLLQSRLYDLPHYPFDHSVGYWRESRISRQYHFKTAAPHELLGVRSREDNMHELKWRNVLKLDKIPWLEHHSFQGQALLPASAYCVMALDAARYFLDGRPASLVELRDVQILSGIAIDQESPGVETMFSLAISPIIKNSLAIDATFHLYSCPADGTTKMKENVSGSLHIVLGEPFVDVLPPKSPCLSETMSADPRAFYEMMEATGLTYTGPFRALTSIQRRYQYCSTTLTRFHPDDTTTLETSPATLDACFQTAFLSYASPGDGQVNSDDLSTETKLTPYRSLWTSFLPTSISRLRFNLAALEGNAAADHKATLIVDTHTIRRTPPVEASKASIVVDIAIFNEDGEAEIQVEELAVRALANTQPKDDLELYLHTVMDVDPTDDIVQPDDEGPGSDGILLAESCCRIASFCLDNYLVPQEDDVKFETKRPHYIVQSNQSRTTKGLTNETQYDIDSLIRNSNHASYLEAIRSVGELDPTRLSQALPSITEEARHVALFRNHVGRILKQITHRYPWMNILYLTSTPVEFISPILAAIGSSFQSFTVGMSQSHSPFASQDTAASSVEGVQMQNIDLEETLRSQIEPDSSLDLVLLPTALLGKNDPSSILKNIGDVMKPGGFLVLVNPYSTILNSQSRTLSGHSPERPPTPPHWPDILDAYGFVEQARNSDQFHQAGYVLVRQFRDPMPASTSTGSNSSSSITESLLLIRGTSGKGDNQLVTNLQHQLSLDCSYMMTCSLDDASTQDLENCTAVIMLAELEEPLMSSMTEHRINQLRTLLRPTLTVLWVTCDARTGNPEHAASFGFLRTIVAEVPTLKLQVLDLEPGRTACLAEIITTAFALLTSIEKDASANSLWTLEPEIHMEGGRRLIPRVMPWKHANDRVNALQRVVTRPINTLRQCIEVVPNLISNDSLRFEVKYMEQSICEASRGNVMIQVDFSSALPLKLSEEVSAYVCVGREWTTGERMVALSGTNSSYITCPSSQTSTLQGRAPPSLVILHQLIRCLAALTIVSVSSYHEQTILIDPDVDFARSLVGVVAPSASSSDRVVILSTCCNKADVLQCTNTQAEELGLSMPLCLHPRTSMKDLRQIFSRDGKVFNFLPGENDLSRRIMDSLSSGSYNYYSGFSMFSSETILRKGDFPPIKSVWKVATMLALQQTLEDSRGSECFRTVSLNEIQSQSRSVQPFQIINWKGDRDTLQPIGHIVDEQLIFSNKTYFLFGMTRDFGHSLCRFFIEHGAKNIVLASRNPNTSPHWVAELRQTYRVDIRIERADVTSLEGLVELKRKVADTMPPVGGVVNGAMVLEDRVFAQMTIETWNRVLRPKTVGSANLDLVFDEPDLDFFIMTSSFAAIGGHAGQSNYAAANMYMNGLAANRRQRGLAGFALNIGVIYGLGFLQREKDYMYAGLEREGYPPISEHNLHHMFLEAIVAGRPDEVPGQPFDITTGLRRYQRGSPNPLHWHRDPRFGHFSTHDKTNNSGAAVEAQKNLQEELAGLTQKEAVADAIGAALEQRLQMLLQLPEGSIDRNNSLTGLGVDSLAAVEVRNWFYKSLGKDVAVMKILDAPSIQKCDDTFFLFALSLLISPFPLCSLPFLFT
ncbi:beta-ketoacyl synthase domain-containing protein [Xylariaceae sp. AK1471]|nr:beta-ketoacyl synthase domain-containing protein [Xylariaceae sp. AK1471]